MDAVRPYVEDKKRNKRDKLPWKRNQANGISPEIGPLDSKVWQDVAKETYKENQVTTGSNLQFYQNALWKEIKGEEKEASKVSAPSPAIPNPLGCCWKNYAESQTNKVPEPDVDAGFPWRYWRCNSTVNQNTSGIDALKSFWVDYNAAYAEMEKLSILAEKNKLVDDPDPKPETSLWQAFSKAEPSSPVCSPRSPIPAPVIISPHQYEFTQYQEKASRPMSRQDEEEITLNDQAFKCQDFTDVVVKEEARSMIDEGEKEESHPMSHQNKEIALDDEAFECQDVTNAVVREEAHNMIDTQEKEQDEEIALDDEASECQDLTEAVIVKEEAQIMLDKQESEADIINNDKQEEKDVSSSDIQEKRATAADIQPNVAQTSKEISVKLSDMIEPVKPRLKLFDLVEGSTVKLADLIKPPTKVVARRRRW